jgi:hypothetical protein
VTDEVRQTRPQGQGEEWVRWTDEPEIRGVTAFTDVRFEGWFVSVYPMEFVHDDPLEVELRERIDAALRRVSGVTHVEEHDREKWFVTGNPSGEALAVAVAAVVDELAPRTRAYALRRPP